LRIAIVMSHASRRLNGALRDLHFARALILRGAETQLFRMHGGTDLERELHLDGAVSATFCPADNPEEIPHRQISAALRQAVSEFAPDVVLYKGLGYAVNVDVQASLPAATRIALVVGGGVTDPLLDRAALVLGEYREQLALHFPTQFRGGQALVLPKLVDLDLAGPGIPVTKAKAEFDIVNVGTFAEKRKNQGALLPFAASHRLAFVGGGPLLRELRRSVPEDQRARINYLGQLPHAQVFGVLRRSRIMVHSATMDGLPRAMMEAMACGLPVVALRSTILGGVPLNAGFLVSEAALPHAVELLLADEALRIRMGNIARRHVETRHGPGAIALAAEETLRVLG